MALDAIYIDPETLALVQQHTLMTFLHSRTNRSLHKSDIVDKYFDS